MSNLVANYYQQRVQREWERLDRYKMEFEVTKKVLSQYMTAPSLKVLDIGGGPGRYSFFLAEKGHKVTLVDLCEDNVLLAKEKSKKLHITLEDYVVSDARFLTSIPSNSFDVVLLMGPLYHLIDSDDRSAAIKEAMRVLKPQGIVFASFITPYERLRFIANYNPAYLNKNIENVNAILEQGVQLKPIKVGPQGCSFCQAHFTKPAEVIPLMEAHKLETLSMHGLEIIGGRPYEVASRLKGEQFKKWVDLNYKLSSDPTLHACADHLLYVGRKI